MLTRPKRNSCRMTILVSNTSNKDIQLYPRTVSGDIENVTSVTPLEVRRVENGEEIVNNQTEEILNKKDDIVVEPKNKSKISDNMEEGSKELPNVG